MEPMTLGSPGGSPAASNSPYLPSFLMGDSNPPTTTRNNTLSPTRGHSVTFATSPTGRTPPDFNRTNFESRPLFGRQETPSTHTFQGTPQHQHNHKSNNGSGPPTQGLFDLLRKEKDQIETPTKSVFNQSLRPGTPATNICLNQSSNDSYLSQPGFNVSRIMSPTSADTSDIRSNNTSYMLSCYPPPRFADFWITIFGFPQSATSLILSHFSQCGTIIDKLFPPHGGNWMHLKFSSRLECDKALNYNEKILGNNIMIGVTYCKDANVIDKENLCNNNNQISRARPLSQAGYNAAQSDLAVAPNPSAPQRSSGIVNRAMDLLFGW